MSHYSIFCFLLTQLANFRFSYYIWPTWVVWGFERLFRLARYLTLNVFLRPSHSKARLSLISSDSLRLTLTRRIPLGWMPGQHVFLAFPTVSNVPLESHPFTIANIPKEGEGEQELVFIIRGREGLTKRLVERAAEKDGVKIPVFLDGPYGNPTNLRPHTTCVLIAGKDPPLVYSFRRCANGLVIQAEAGSRILCLFCSI